MDMGMVKILGIGANWCSKCKSAKEYLKDQPIQWLDYDKPESKPYLAMFHPDNIPFFIVVEDDGTTKLISSMLEAKKAFEKV
jgi:hypothetical protein